uniref:SWIM-type domain-containing protein n=1 Tax=Fagus sylvatica TaxID=28930 RepID=A0A2N9GDG2_FAGSY
MDVAASYLSTKQMGPAGPTSEKAAKQMKNAAIFVAKRTKNWAWEAREVQRVLSFFFPPPGLLLHHAWPLKQPLKHSKHKVVAVMSTQEMDGVRSFGASNSFVEDLPQPVEGNMQDTPESVRNSVIEPRVGMEFDSLQQVIEFYKNYAYSKGFATMTRSSRKNKGFTETSYINLKCNREGRYSSLVDDPSKKRSTIKNACEAGIKALMDITDHKKWRILSFIENHNHDLSPSKSRHFAAFRHISTDTRRRLLINDNAGVRINSSIKASIVEAGGYENVTYNQRDVRNFLEKERRLKCKEGDGQALHDYFVRMQAKNSNFYHALDLDDELLKLAGLEAYQDIKNYLLKAVHESMTVEEFEEKWNHTITSHHLEENEWLAKLYEERERWVPAFLNSNFFAGINSRMQCGIRLKKRFYQILSVSKASWSVPHHLLWRNSSKKLTPMRFLSGCELEFSGRQGCIVNELVRGGDEEKYKIEDEACSGKLFEVRFSSSECLVGCVCRMFEFRGILCRHALFVLSQERVTVLPDRYILDRWRKDIKRKHTYVSTCTDDVQHNPVLERYEKLHRLAVGVLEIGAESVENFNVLEKLLIDLKDNFPRSCDKQPSSQRKNSVGAAPDVVRTEVVRSPMVVKRKGRPRMKRLKSSMEEAVSKPKKKRNTAAARNLAHSTSTTGVGGSAYGDGSTSNMEYPVSMPHSNDGVIDLTNPMPSQSFVSESMSQTQAHGNEDQALNLT